MAVWIGEVALRLGIRHTRCGGWQSTPWHRIKSQGLQIRGLQSGDRRLLDRQVPCGAGLGRRCSGPLLQVILLMNFRRIGLLTRSLGVLLPLTGCGSCGFRFQLFARLADFVKAILAALQLLG